MTNNPSPLAAIILGCLCATSSLAELIITSDPEVPHSRKSSMKFVNLPAVNPFASLVIPR